jgi:hypothetical protein
LIAVSRHDRAGRRVEDRTRIVAQQRQIVRDDLERVLTLSAKEQIGRLAIVAAG